MTICQLAAWARIAFEITEMPFRLIKRVWHQLDALKRNSRFAQPTRLIFAKRTAERAEVAAPGAASRWSDPSAANIVGGKTQLSSRDDLDRSDVGRVNWRRFRRLDALRDSA